MADLNLTDARGRSVGYARVSSTEQETALQQKALNLAGVQLVYEEKRSAVKRRPVLEKMLSELQPGDVVHVYKVDRLARSLFHLLHIMERLQAAGAGFRSLTEPIETVTPAGRMMLHILGSVAEFERAIIRERSMAGQLVAMERGRHCGRPRALSEVQEVEAVRRVRQDRETMSSVARGLGVHLSSVKRAVLRVVAPDSPAVAFARPQRPTGSVGGVRP